MRPIADRYGGNANSQRSLLSLAIPVYMLPPGLKKQKCVGNFTGKLKLKTVDLLDSHLLSPSLV